MNYKVFVGDKARPVEILSNRPDHSHEPLFSAKEKVLKTQCFQGFVMETRGIEPLTS